MSNYIFKHEGKNYDPIAGVVLVEDVEAHNKTIEAEELQRWHNSKITPSVFHAYVRSSTVTTWLGTKLGTIIKRSEYHNNFGGMMEAITVKGTNGSIYWGLYDIRQQLVRLKKRRRRADRK